MSYSESLLNPVNIGVLLWMWMCSRSVCVWLYLVWPCISLSSLSLVWWLRVPAACCSRVMVDMESHYHPPSPLEDSVLGSPLCADDDFMGSMEELQDISQSIDNDTLSSLDVPEYQSSSNGSEGSTVLGTFFFFFLTWMQIMSFDCFIAQKLQFIPKTENVIAIAVDQTRFTCIWPLMPCVFLLKA